MIIISFLLIVIKVKDGDIRIESLQCRKIIQKFNRIKNKSFQIFISHFLGYLLLNPNYLDKKEYKDENIFNKEILEGFELFLKAYEDFAIFSKGLQDI